MSIESVLLERLLGEVAKLTQPQFADESNTQRCVRTQTRLAPPVILHDGQEIDISQKSLDYVTNFDGPWELSFLAVKFLKPLADGHAPDTEVEDLVVSVRLNGEDYPLSEQLPPGGIAFYAHPLRFASGDQLSVLAFAPHSTMVLVEVRGTSLA